MPFLANFASYLCSKYEHFIYGSSGSRDPASRNYFQIFHLDFVLYLYNNIFPGFIITFFPDFQISLYPPKSRLEGHTPFYYIGDEFILYPPPMSRVLAWTESQTWFQLQIYIPSFNSTMVQISYINQHTTASYGEKEFSKTGVTYITL